MTSQIHDRISIADGRVLLGKRKLDLMLMLEEGHVPRSIRCSYIHAGHSDIRLFNYKDEILIIDYIISELCKRRYLQSADASRHCV